MKTKLLYILVSSTEDTYYESALISIYSARKRMPSANIILLTDNFTNKNLVNNRREILKYINEKIVINLSFNISNKIKSRLLKTNMRKHIKGDFLYIDSDTIITNALDEIDSFFFDIGATIDGHIPINKHPVKDLFDKENTLLDYPYYKVEKYYAGGVIYVKDTEKAKTFFNLWYKNYNEGLKKDITQDEPSLSKTNYELNNMIYELEGKWNCQIRLGAFFFNAHNILHFISKANMPISSLGDKEYLLQIKKYGLTQKVKNEIINYKKTLYQPLGVVVEKDLFFNYSKTYESSKELYYSKENEYLYNFYMLVKQIKKGSNNKFIFYSISIIIFILKIEVLIFKLLRNDK